MAAFKLWYTSTLLSCTPSKSLSKPSPLASTPSISSHFPVPPSLSSSNLFGCHKSSSLSFRTLCECTPVTGDTGFPENYVDEGGVPGEFDDEFDDEDYSIDVEAFEEEAKDVAREYSSSLSRELRLGACSSVLTDVFFFSCVSYIFVIVKEKYANSYVRWTVNFV